MTTTIYSKKKNTEVKTFKMICPEMGFIFKFSTDNVELYMEEHEEYHGQRAEGYTYQEV